MKNKITAEFIVIGVCGLILCTLASLLSGCGSDNHKRCDVISFCNSEHETCNLSLTDDDTNCQYCNMPADRHVVLPADHPCQSYNTPQ